MTPGIIMLAIVVGGLTIEHCATAWKDRGIAQAKAEVEKAKVLSSKDDAR